MKKARQYECRFTSDGGRVEHHWPCAYAVGEPALREAISKAEPGAVDVDVRFVREVEIEEHLTVYGWPRPEHALRSRHVALHGELSLAEIQSLATISSGHADDLKIDSDGVRVWLSRMTVQDGAAFDNEVTVEIFHRSTGQWARYKSYPAVSGT